MEVIHQYIRRRPVRVLCELPDDGSRILTLTTVGERSALRGRRLA